MNEIKLELTDKSKERFLVMSRGSQITYVSSRSDGRLMHIPDKLINWKNGKIRAIVGVKV